MDAKFGHWLAGFTDGEGSFDINRNPHGSYACRFAISLRIDDLPILQEIQRATAIGKIVFVEKYGTSAAQARWIVNNKTDCVALVEVFDCYPLRAKKARDFAIWREAVYVWRKAQRRRRFDWTAMIELQAALRATRRLGAPVGIPTRAVSPQLSMEADE